MSGYKNVVYATGSILTTLVHVQKSFPQLNISDDITEDELNALDLDWSGTPYGEAMDNGAKMLRHSMRQTRENAVVNVGTIGHIDHGKPNTINPLVLAIRSAH